MPLRGAGALVLILLLLSGLAPLAGRPAQRVPAIIVTAAVSPRETTADVVSPPAGLQAAGLASFYGGDFHGRPMANGRPFDMHDPAIAASNRWPLGTRLKVRRLPGSVWDAHVPPSELQEYWQRSIEVVVEDRGLFSHELDLSAAAFAQLGRPDEGIIRVSIEPLN